MSATGLKDGLEEHGTTVVTNGRRGGRDILPDSVGALSHDVGTADDVSCDLSSASRSRAHITNRGASLHVVLAFLGVLALLQLLGRVVRWLFVIENQYGRADHDHLTRGLAYAVARHANGLVGVAEERRDELRAVAQYLNELAELDSE